MGLLCWLLAAAALRTWYSTVPDQDSQKWVTGRGIVNSNQNVNELKGEKSFSVSHVDHEQQAMIEKAGVCREQGLDFFWKEGLEEKNIRKTQLNWVLSTNS